MSLVKRGGCQMGSMNYQKSYRLLHIGLYGGMAAMVFGAGAEILWLAIAGLAAVLAGLVQAVFFCRCPHCGAAFNIRAKLPKFCPDCGKELEKQERGS